MVSMTDEMVKEILRYFDSAKTKPKPKKETMPPKKTTDTETDIQKEFQHVEFQNKGSKMILPEGMNYATALDALTKKMKEEETQVRIYEVVDAFPLDGANAFMHVLKNKYGWASPVPKRGFFGDTPPVLKDLEIGYGVFTQVIWGQFQIPGIEGLLETGVDHSNGRMGFCLQGTVKKKHQEEIKAIAKLVREYVKTDSVYKGQAIRLQTDDDGDLDVNEHPRFMDLSNVKEDELVLPEGTLEQVETSIFTPIQYTEACEQNSVPLKRGVLMEGKYGIGKTLTAYVTAKKSADNGWTFIYLDRVSGLRDALHFAKQYQPAVIFAEDIDRVVSGEDRTTELDDILNSIDGIESKNTKIMVVLTTNHIEKINRAMLRPGRLDAVISIKPPDSKAAQKLMTIYGRGLIDPNEDLTEAGEELAGQIPAVIREVVERSKLFSISRSKGQSFKLTGKDIANAARGMKSHLDLLNPPVKKPATVEEAFGGSFKQLMQSNEVDSGLLKKVTAIDQKVESIADKLN